MILRSLRHVLLVEAAADLILLIVLLFAGAVGVGAKYGPLPGAVALVVWIGLCLTIYWLRYKRL